MSDNFILYSGWVFGLIGLLATAVGIYYAINAHKRHPLKALELRQKGLDRMHFPTNAEEYKFTLNGSEVVGRLTRTKLLLKNIGNTGIEPSDLRPGTNATIEFEIKDGTLVGVYVTKEGDEKTRAKLTVKQVGNIVKLNWDYFDPQDEFTIAAYDTGYQRTVKLKGDFKSGVVVSNHEEKKDSKLKAAAGVVALLAGLLLFMGLGGFAAILLVETPKFHFALTGSYWQKLYVGLLAALLSLLAIAGLLFLLEKVFQSARKHMAKVKGKLSKWL